MVPGDDIETGMTGVCVSGTGENAWQSARYSAFCRRSRETCVDSTSGKDMLNCISWTKKNWCSHNVFLANVSTVRSISRRRGTG